MAKHNQEDQWRHTDELIRKRLPLGVALVCTFRTDAKIISRISWSPDGRILAASADRAIQLWDLETGDRSRRFDWHDSQVRSVAFNPSGSILASGSDDKTVALWDLNSGRLLQTLQHSEAVYGVSWSPDGQLFASASSDGVVAIRDTETWRLRDHAADWGKYPKGVMLNIAWSTDSKRLGGASYDAPIWDAKSGKRIHVLESRDGLYDVAWSPDSTSRWLAAGSSGDTVKLWDTNTGREIRALEGHTKHVRSVAFSPDAKLLASSSDDNTTRIWSCDSWQEVAVIRKRRSGHSSSGLAFHPSLPFLAVVGSESGTGNGVIHILRLDLAVILQQRPKPRVNYTSAKVVLVGESNVGKSYLAHRIATGARPDEGNIKSTHGMKFWPLELRMLGPSATAPAEEHRDVVLWDMGGQDEYRLIHQMFLHDTTVALVLLDPTRGSTAFKEVETWNKSLEKQFRDRAAIKLLVGAKVDQPSEMIDRQALERLCRDCGFAGYFETSAIEGRGITELCEAMGRAIDWDILGKTTRPELFQAIRDEIEIRRKSGVVVVLFDELDRELQTNEELDTFSLMAHEVSMASDAAAGTRALDVVCSQLAQQGMIARAKTSSGMSALVLRIEEIERYAGSLILAARNNPRGVPALELRAIAQEGFHFPQIPDNERLPREQEKSVLECTVQLMLEHGICFQHEGLLIFASLFAPAPESTDNRLPHAISLYYDFAGAIDNIYASLIAWLVLAKEFGKVRLWSDRAEFEVKDGGLCGLRKVGRPGGFAHVDVYFESETPERQRQEFISFVEDHLARNGVEIREHVAIKCSCGHEFAENTLRQRIARGDKDVVCPVCETRHSLNEGAAVARERDPKITKHTWALRTRIEKLREKLTKNVVEVLAKKDAKPVTTPIRLLHLSDLHFNKETPVGARLQWLLDDLKQDSGLGFKELDYLVISGDFTDKGCVEGFEKAYEFVSGLTEEFGLSAERCILVPGNHDLRDIREAYEWRDKADGLKEGEWVKQGDIVLARNAEKYPLRFKPFSDSFYHKFLQRPYPLDFVSQGFAIPFLDTKIQFLALDSCWQIDQFHRKRSGIHVEAVANAVKRAQRQEQDARMAGHLTEGDQFLRIAVWHHAVAGPEQMKDTEFLGNLQKNGARLALHGDVHEARKDQVGYLHDRQVHVVGSGAFGARAQDRPESSPRLYNVIEIARDLRSVRVHTRCQPKIDGPWDGWHEWTDPDGGKGRVAYYDIKW